MLNVALKTAIIESRKRQQRIADLARIDRTIFSHIVCGRRKASPEQRQRIAAILKKSEAYLFASEVSA